MQLLIVESPTKAKTIAKFLDKKFKVESSFGHVRDLPKRELGIDLEHNFAPTYVVARVNQKRVTALKKLAAKADKVYLATDADREGEAISWHLQEIFKLPKDKIARIAFHEITAAAVKEAIEHSRQIDLNLVDAQQARRILDRLVGYKLSPFLWKKVVRGLSAGRVQSVAVRLIVEREQEIEAFKPEEYWNLEADFAAGTGKGKKTSTSKNKDMGADQGAGASDAENKFRAQLQQVSGKKLSQFSLRDGLAAENWAKEIRAQKFSVATVTPKTTQKNPLPPFTTSTLQQAANNRLGFSAKQTMMLAQRLYEGVDLDKLGSGGLITYMRTDSLNLGDNFLNEAAAFLKKTYGAEYALENPRRFKTKSKSAQEAHEAIRPTRADLTPDQVRPFLDPKQFKLYDLIWRRALASQMPPAKVDNLIVDIASADKKFVFRARGSRVNFPGFLQVYQLKVDENILPELTAAQALDLIKLDTLQHFTQPPARFTEASLVKALEEYGIGRPSTYAPIINTIKLRNYVTKEERCFKPTEIGTLVTKVLTEHFPNIMDYEFTAGIEDKLDKVADGKEDWQKLIGDFYTRFEKLLTEKTKSVDKKELTEEATDHLCPKCGSPMVIKLGRFGKFLACSKYPECKTTQPLGNDGEPEPPELIDEKCPECGKPMQIKTGRFGKFLACSDYPKCKYTKHIVKSTGITCPKCGKGEIVEKRSKRGKTFYACSAYPACKNAYWSKPTGEKCPECGSLLVYGAKNTIVCSQKGCGYKKAAE